MEACFGAAGLVMGGGEGSMEIYGVEPGERVVRRVRMESADFSTGFSLDVIESREGHRGKNVCKIAAITQFRLSSVAPLVWGSGLLG